MAFLSSRSSSSFPLYASCPMWVMLLRAGGGGGGNGRRVRRRRVFLWSSHALSCREEESDKYLFSRSHARFPSFFHHGFFSFRVSDQGPRTNPLRPGLQAAQPAGGGLLRTGVPPQQGHGKIKRMETLSLFFGGGL